MIPVLRPSSSWGSSTERSLGERRVIWMQSCVCNPEKTCRRKLGKGSCWCFEHEICLPCAWVKMGNVYRMSRADRELLLRSHTHTTLLAQQKHSHEKNIYLYIHTEKLVISKWCNTTQYPKVMAAVPLLLI